MTNNSDRAFRSLALRYAELEGAALKQENEWLRQNGGVFVTPRLDETVKQLLGEKKKKKRRRAAIISAAAVIAACLILVFALPMRMQNGDAGSDSAEQQLIPITFAMPANFSVSAAELDNGKSVYSLANTERDDVVLIMEDAALEPGDYTGYEILYINGAEVYADATPNYQTLVFEKDDVVYTLSCEHDINTLIELGEAILT